MIRGVILSILLIFSSFAYANSKPNLIVYCGITMVKPIKEIAKIIEKKHNCDITISQGGSKDLYDQLFASKVGDLYLPGSDSYVKRGLNDNVIEKSVDIGYNQAALFVQRGNPKGIKDLNDLLNEKNIVTICNPKSGSIGRMTKKLLTKFKGEDFFFDVYDVAAQIGTDSRNLNKSLIDKTADVTINWRATGFWPENSPYISVVEIDEKFAPKKRLLLNLLKFSKNKKIANAFIDFASSKEGQEIMHKYGFR
jgi:molybdate transport system substrate-binding protein